MSLYIAYNGERDCSNLDRATCYQIQSANSVYGKFGRIASEEVILQLAKSKCIPILLYGLEVCELHKFHNEWLHWTLLLIDF